MQPRSFDRPVHLLFRNSFWTFLCAPLRAQRSLRLSFRGNSEANCRRTAFVEAPGNAEIARALLLTRRRRYRILGVLVVGDDIGQLGVWHDYDAR